MAHRTQINGKVVSLSHLTDVAVGKGRGEGNLAVWPKHFDYLVVFGYPLPKQLPNLLGGISASARGAGFVLFDLRAGWPSEIDDSN